MAAATADTNRWPSRVEIEAAIEARRAAAILKVDKMKAREMEVATNQIGRF